MNNLVRKDIATRKTKTFLRYVNQSNVSRILLKNLIKDKRPKKVNKAFLARIKAMYKNVLFSGTTQDKSAVCLVFVNVNYNAERSVKTEDSKHYYSDTILIFTALYAEPEGVFTGNVLFTYHAVLRTLERCNEALHLDLDELLHYFHQIANAVHLHKNDHAYDVLKIGDDITVKDIQFKVNVGDLEVRYEIVETNHSNFSAAVKTVVPIKTKRKPNT